MVQTFVIPASGILKKYVRGFEIREFNTFDQVMSKPVHAFHEALISIFIQGSPQSFTSASGSEPLFSLNNGQNNFAGIMGVQSFLQGTLNFQGYIKVLNVQFMPTGFYNIFKIPAHAISDKMLNIQDILNNKIGRLQEQLYGAKNTTEMVGFTEQFLLAQLAIGKMKNSSDNILNAATFLLKNPGALPVSELAYQTNMTGKTFERKFMEQVGITPKLYDRIRRFNLALDMKMEKPNLSWTHICHHMGYYDQMHFIKDFKKFAGETPSAFFKNTPPPNENIYNL